MLCERGINLIPGKSTGESELSRRCDQAFDLIRAQTQLFIQYVN